MAKTTLEPELLQGAPLRYAPNNEMGVVFLFSHLCRRMQIQVLSVQAGFPDCIALQRVGGKERRIRIEFEFRSSNFRAHGHLPDGCDWIVCWEHDWPDVPDHLKVVELREFFDQGFNVWVDVGQPQDDWPVRGMHTFGKRVSKGDLVLFYEASPCQWLRQVYMVSGLAPKEQQGRQGVTTLSRLDRIEMIAEAKEQQGRQGVSRALRNNPSLGDAIFGTGYRHVYVMRRVCVLDPPLHIKSLETKNLAVVKESIFSQKHNRKITEHWWLLYETIVRKYPDLAGAFAPFSPSRI
jgi:hypothetical protein